MPITIRPVVSMQYGFVTDRETDKGTHDDGQTDRATSLHSVHVMRPKICKFS